MVTLRTQKLTADESFGDGARGHEAGVRDLFQNDKREKRKKGMSRNEIHGRSGRIFFPNCVSDFETARRCTCLHAETVEGLEATAHEREERERCMIGRFEVVA